jgi:hypothetical protein
MDDNFGEEVEMRKSLYHGSKRNPAKQAQPAQPARLERLCAMLSKVPITEWEGVYVPRHDWEKMEFYQFNATYGGFNFELHVVDDRKIIGDLTDDGYVRNQYKITLNVRQEGDMVESHEKQYDGWPAWLTKQQKALVRPELIALYSWITRGKEDIKRREQDARTRDTKQKLDKLLEEQ